MLKSLNHITLAVANLDVSFQFYVDILGFRPEAKWQTGAYLSLGDLWLCLSLDDVDKHTDYTHYAFTIAKENIAPFRQKLAVHNVTEWKQNKSEGDSIYFLDPDGHKLEAHIGNLQSRLQTCKINPYEDMVFF